MTERQRKAFIQRCVNHLVELLGLPKNWVTRLRYRYEEGTKATADCDHEYHRGTLTFNLEELTDKEEARRTVAHEVAHVATWPLHYVAGELAKSEENQNFREEMVREANERVAMILEPLLYFILLDVE